MFSKKFGFVNLWTFKYEGEGDQGGDKGDQSGPGDKGSQGDNSNKTFSQDEVNRIVAKEKEKVKQQQTKLLSDLETFKKKANLSEQELATVNGQIENIRKEMMSKEELLKEERDRERKDYTTRIQATEQERDAWRQRFTKSTVDRSLMDAALEFKAYNPEQVIALLSPNTRLVEVVDEAGKGTGQFIPKVTYQTADSNGKPITLDLTPKEVVKKMTEEKRFANLFVSDAKSGLGMFNGNNNNSSSDAPPKDTAQYIAWRKKKGN